MGKTNFSSRKLPSDLDIQTLRSKYSLVFCAIILLICSIIVLFMESIADSAITLFSNYGNLPQKQVYEIETNYTGNSFNNIEIKNLFTPSYIVAGGDVMLSRNIGYFAKNEGYDRIFKEGRYNPLTEFKNCKSNNCLLFLNLEGLFADPDHDIRKGGFDFRANPKNVETLLQYRQDKPLLLALPNNHFINGGFQGLTMTKEVLKKNNIYSVGAGFTQEESREIFTWDNNGIKFCLGAYSYDGGSAKVRGGIVFWNEISESNIKQDLERMKEMECDAKIISLHWGAEYRFSPNAWQRNLAHNLIDSGADLILGGHSHIPGEFEIYNGKYVFYSLGNFIFDQGWGKSATGREFNYFYDIDLGRTNVPTYISMLIGLSFRKNIIGGIDIDLEQIEFSSTTDGIFSIVGEETRNNLLEKINLTNLKY